jgi:magnesium-transporting ATPase (P-type)
METFDARNLLVLLLVLFENVHVFNVRSEARSAFRVPLSANRLLVLGVLLAQGLHIGSMFVPGWRDVLAIAPVSPQTWAVLLAITLSKFAVVELYKALRGRRLFAASHGQAAPSTG